MSNTIPITFETFDPNQPNKANVWGVYDDYTFKTKSTRPAALNALRACGRGKLFELVNGTWILRATKDPYNIMNGFCDGCGASLVVKGCGAYDYTLHMSIPDGKPVVSAYWDWKRVSGRIVSPPELLRLCTACKRGYA